MKEIFTDLYKKVLGFFQAQEKEKGESDRDIACSRMKLVLMQDRTNLTPYLLERMRGEMIDVLSKYVEMNQDELELNFEQEGDSMALMLSIPVVRAKDEEEIQAMVEAEEAKKAEEEASQENEDETSEDTEQNEKANTDEQDEETDAENDEQTEEVQDGECNCTDKCDESCECGCHNAENQENSEEADATEENNENNDEETSSDTENKKAKKKNKKNK